MPRISYALKMPGLTFIADLLIQIIELARYFTFLLCFVFSLCERKNEAQLKKHIPCCKPAYIILACQGCIFNVLSSPRTQMVTILPYHVWYSHTVARIAQQSTLLELYDREQPAKPDTAAGG